MPVSLTRDMVNSYSTAVTGGTTPADLFIRDVPDFIPIIGRTDVSFIKTLGTGKTGKMLKMEYGSGDVAPRTVNLTAAVLDGVATGLTVDVASSLQVYDMLYFPDNGEIARVTALPGTASPNVTVARGHGGTPAAAHASGLNVLIIAPAVPEGADTPYSPIAQGEVDWNTYQILEYSWVFTHRGRVVPTYEVQTDRFKHEVKKKMEEAALDLNNLAIYGVRALGDGSKTNPSTTAGVRQATTHNRFNLNAAPLTLATFMDMFQQIYLDVGQNNMAKTVFLNPFSKRIVNSFFNATRRTSGGDAKMSIKWDTVETDFGEIRFIIQYDWPKGEAFAVNTEDCKRHAFEGGNWSTGLMSTDGWYDRGFLRGDFGFSWQAPRRRGALVNFSTARADYPNIDKVQGNMA